MAALSRRVVKGVPRYTNEDEFTDPDNEVIVPVLGSDGKPVSSPKRKLLDTDLKTEYRVTQYRPGWKPHLICCNTGRRKEMFQGARLSFGSYLRQTGRYTCSDMRIRPAYINRIIRDTLPAG